MFKNRWHLVMDPLCHEWLVRPWVNQSRPQGNYSLYRGSTHSQTQVHFCFVSCDFAFWTLVIFNTLIFLRHSCITAFQAINSDRSGRVTRKLELSLQDVWSSATVHSHSDCIFQSILCNAITWASINQPTTRNNKMSLWMLFLKGNDIH